jgi:predicted MPP superfamily phosphohydrolase
MNLVGLAMLLAACVGHTALCVSVVNWSYGHALPRPILRVIRHLNAGLVAGFPLLLWWTYGFEPPLINQNPSAGNARDVLSGYVVFCWLIGLGVVPALTLARLLRRPAALVASEVRTIDIRKRLKYCPLGRGRHRWLARLPGNEAFRVDFAEKTLALPRLPEAWEGLTVLHLSDLHFSGSPDRVFYQEVMDLCAQWEPDLVAYTGDTVDTYQHYRWILSTLGCLRWRIGAFAVLGNHDAWHEPMLIRRRLRRIGMDVIGNSWKEVEVRGQKLIVVGNEAPWFAPAPDLTAAPSEPFRLCLSHTPDNIGWARCNRVDLMLAGHNHGGQIRFPVIGSVLVPSRYSRRYDCGVFDEPPTVLHVSRGVGGQHPVRYNCRPEVVRITLRRSAQQSA